MEHIMRKRIAFIMIAFIFALMGCASVEPNQEEAPVPTEMTISVENPQTSVTEQENKAEDTTTTVSVIRWSASCIGDAISHTTDFEEVEVEFEEDMITLLPLGDGDFVYEISAEWGEVGGASYTFRTIPQIRGEQEVNQAFDESRKFSGSDRNEIFKAVLLGDSPFICCAGGNVETMVITDIPALFDEYDTLMKVWDLPQLLIFPRLSI